MRKPLLLLFCVFALFSCFRIPEIQRPKSAVTYTFEGGKDIIKLFDFTATYTDKDNNAVKEKITSLPWNREIIASLPFESHLEVDFSVKDDFPDQHKYDVGFNAFIELSDKGKSGNNATISKFQQDDGVLRFSVDIPDGVSPDDIAIAVAPLKYDKHFAFSFTIDDASENGWSRIFRLIHGKWIDDKEFFHLGCAPTTGYIPEHTLSVTDGCGNERRFGVGEAIWPTFRNSFNDFEPRMKDTSESSIYITWEELRIMLDFGCSVHFHNVDETKYDKNDVNQIVQGFFDDYDKVQEKLGRKMKVLALPDGLQSYIDAAYAFPRIEFIRSSLSDNLIYLNDCGSLNGKETYGGKHTSDISKKLEELAAQAASENPYWVGLTVHRPSIENMDMLTDVYKLYGKAGADNIWVASWDEVYEYQELRYGSVISKNVAGNAVNFEITLPDRSNFYFNELSFLISGVQGATVIPESGNIYGLSFADRNGVCWLMLTLIRNCVFARKDILLNTKHREWRQTRMMPSILFPCCCPNWPHLSLTGSLTERMVQ